MCSGGKSSKVRLIGMLVASTTGEKISMLVIVKLKNPHCFKNERNLPCSYKAQKKSWMNTQISEKLICKLDQNIGAEGKKPGLLIDDCPTQLLISSLTNIQLIFLLLITTSVLQPLG